METFDIGDRPIGPGHETFVIAEAGSNHNGDFETAKSLVDAAADAGADAVKFQTFRVDSMYAEQDEESDDLLEQFESLEMPYDWIPILADYCRESGVQFLSTPFDEQSAAELAEHVPAFKIASMSMSNLPFLRSLGEFDVPLVLSTGGHEFTDIATAVETLDDANVSEYVLLQCVAAYPAPLDRSNVRVVETLREEFDCLAGLSDHTLDPTTAPTVAVSLGATIVEKHFTLDNSMEGPDHSFALEPDELEAMVDAIRKTEQALGSPEKRVLDVEQDVVSVAKRGIHVVRDVPADTTLDTTDIAVRRPGQRERGLDPSFYDDVIGRTTATALDAGEPLTWEKLRD
ncbi:N-acetylneuraminate synthase family protein [Haloplanus aerogenes]|uniref:N-acetylneuraminate synthase n=1 Tax=Haloplanus aerogenes TaxID=660522 RepID=A0A3M0DCT0_9EURY|nr:N-acetylneuraminate synthase family protein [Haloplanus aerogenes]AZH26321.1 shikimate dehydrogenase [Haloplanus aerogenes]RMB18220.1 N-acetylneuraminate synthase [Haloplanus aerogenes]